MRFVATQARPLVAQSRAASCVSSRPTGGHTNHTPRSLSFSESDVFIAVEIDSSPGNPHAIPRGAQSVLTEHFVDEPGHPTRDALDRVLMLFREKLPA